MNKIRIQDLSALALLIVVAFAAGVSAEDAAELGLRYAGVQQAGIDLLKQYTWESDTKVTAAGELKGQFTVANRMNEKGQMVQEVESAEVNAKRKRGVRGRAQQQQLAESGAFLDKLAMTTGAYIFMSKGQEVDFFDKATVTDGTGADTGKLVVQSKNTLVSGDEVTKVIDPTSLFASRIVFTTVIDGTAVKGEVLLRPIDNGPNVPRMVTITLPDDGRVIETEFLKFEKTL